MLPAWRNFFPSHFFLLMMQLHNYINRILSHYFENRSYLEIKITEIAIFLAEREHYFLCILRNFYLRLNEILG
jgi:hypothetical protein